ncbi:MAG: magnesium transporter [Asgard group archaeon]|nr:magnesium transporter [Asgard group archaeon]
MSKDTGKKLAINMIFGIFLQSMIALFFDTGGIVSGTIANFFMPATQVAWITLMLGPLLAARGDIAVLVGKLGTALHLGVVKPQIRNNTPEYKNLLSAVMTIALLDSVLVGVATYSVNLLTFGENKIFNPTLFFVIPIIVLVLAAFFSTIITSLVSFFTYKRGLNPDIYVCPVMSTVNNILIASLYAGVVNIIRPWKRVETPEGLGYAIAGPDEMLGSYIAIIPAAICVGVVVYIIIRSLKKEDYRKMMKEAMPAVFLSATIGTFTGLVLTRSEEALTRYPQLLIAFPALIGTLVDQCAITSNILITNFSAGYIEPRVISVKEKKVWTTFVGVGLGGLVVTIFLGFIGTFISIGDLIELYGSWFTIDILKVIVVTLLANIIGFIIVLALIFVLSIIAFRKEMDPDNFAIPLVACLADFLCASFIYVFSLLILL